MRKDLVVTTAIAAALVAGLPGCGRGNADGWAADRDTAVCVDRSGRRVADGNCRSGTVPLAGQTSGTDPFLWYYIGRASAVPYYGEPVGGGSYARAPGRTYFSAPAATAVTRSAAVTRGGFGSSAASSNGAGE